MWRVSRQIKIRTNRPPIAAERIMIRAKVWLRDVVADGDVEANPGPFDGPASTRGHAWPLGSLRGWRRRARVNGWVLRGPDGGDAQWQPHWALEWVCKRCGVGDISLGPFVHDCVPAHRPPPHEWHRVVGCGARGALCACGPVEPLKCAECKDPWPLCACTPKDQDWCHVCTFPVIHCQCGNAAFYAWSMEAWQPIYDDRFWDSDSANESDGSRSDDEWERDLTIDGDVESNPGPTARQIEQRDKQVRFGKNTVGYRCYVALVPKRHREENNQDHPHTPTTHLEYSKRGWDATLTQWRRTLHVWDHMESEVAKMTGSVWIPGWDLSDDLQDSEGSRVWVRDLTTDGDVEENPGPPTRNMSKRPQAGRGQLRHVAMQEEGAAHPGGWIGRMCQKASWEWRHE